MADITVGRVRRDLKPTSATGFRGKSRVSFRRTEPTTTREVLDYFRKLTIFRHHRTHCSVFPRCRSLLRRNRRRTRNVRLPAKSLDCVRTRVPSPGHPDQPSRVLIGHMWTRFAGRSGFVPVVVEKTKRPRRKSYKLTRQTPTSRVVITRYRGGGGDRSVF